MPRRVFYRIIDRPDGLFDARVRIEPDGIHRRDGFTSLGQAEAWVDGLRGLMAALGAPVAREDGADRDGEEARTPIVVESRREHR